MKLARHRRPRNARGFTIVELLVVMVIIVLLIGLSVGLNSSGIESHRLVSDADKLILQLSLGQQIAIAENRPVEVRIYRFLPDDRPGDSPQFLGYQLYRIQNDGSDAEPVDTPMRLNDGIVISAKEDYSSLVSLPRRDGWLNSTQNASYVSFQFLPNGETNLPSESPGEGKHWFLTFLFVHEEESGDVPKDFVTVQVDPFTGTSRKLRL